MTELIVPSNPTPNGDLHVGHLAGPFLGADVLRRAALARGEKAALLLGTAWQNTHVLLAAQARGEEHLATAAHFADRIEASLASVGIGWDVMLRHSDIPAISSAVLAAWSRLRADGSVVVRDGAAQWCGTCDDWRFQGYAAGRCPRCGSADAYGIDCEGCGLYHDDAELVDPSCAVCGGPVAPRPLRRAYLELEPLRSWFESYLGSIVLDPVVAAYAATVLAAPLPSVAVSYLGPLGVPLTDPDLPGQRVYPSVELAPRVAVMADRLGGVGPEDRMSMLFGFDNAFERVFLFPAVLRGLPGTVPQAEVMRTTYFYLLDGAKFSTSRGHVVGVEEVVSSYGRDAVRLHVAATRPEDGPADFTRSGLASSAELAAVRGLSALASSGRWPAPGPAGGGQAGRLAEAVAALDEATRPESLRCPAAADAVCSLAELAVSGPDPSLRPALLAALTGPAAALVPDVAGALASAFR